MARPLPKDLEDQIAGAARKSEARSYGVFGFVLGVAVGVGLGVAIAGSGGEAASTVGFVIAAGVLGTVWFLASRKKNS